MTRDVFRHKAAGAGPAPRAPGAAGAGRGGAGARIFGGDEGMDGAAALPWAGRCTAPFPPGARQQSQRAEGFPPSATEQKTTKSKHLDLLFPTYCCIKIQLVH